MNWYFWKIWIPLQILTVASLIGAFIGIIQINWWLVLLSWFLIGPIGVGVGYHRLFSHRQFETWKPVEYTLAILGTLSAYAPLLFWASQHQYHHKVADTKDDPSSPIHGFWESYLWWRLRNTALKKIDLRNVPTRMLLKDSFLLFLSKQFIKIIYATVIILGIIDLSLLVSLFILPAFIERQRVNLVSSISHTAIKFSYKNYETTDRAQNNIIIAYLTMGFGWHNNHHKYPRELVNKHNWWEIDVEGYIARMLSKHK